MIKLNHSFLPKISNSFVKLNFNNFRLVSRKNSGETSGLELQNTTFMDEIQST